MSERGKAARERVAAAIIPDDPRQPVDEYVAAKVLAKSVHWMRRARWAGNGPVYLQIGGNCRYRIQDLEEYKLTGVRRSTSDAGQAA